MIETVKCAFCDNKTEKSKGMCDTCVGDFIKGTSWEVTPERAEEITNILSK